MCVCGGGAISLDSVALCMKNNIMQNSSQITAKSRLLKIVDASTLRPMQSGEFWREDYCGLLLLIQHQKWHLIISNRFSR